VSKAEAEELQKTGLQIRAYRAARGKRALGIFLVGFGGLMLGTIAVFLVLHLLGQIPDAHPIWGGAVAEVVGFGLMAYAGRRALRTGRRLEAELKARVEKEGNYYCCSCGEPMKKYGTLHYLLCCLPPWGLIALFFKLKKCTRCGRPYPASLLATR
jgi:hypothetical protein